MTTLLDSVRIGGLQLTLRACPGLCGTRYAMTFCALPDPVEIGITYLGYDRKGAETIFATKVKCHRTIHAGHAQVPA